MISSRLREPDLERTPQPPANLEAEQALLGAILINNAAYSRVAEVLRPEHFILPVHGRLYAAIGRLVEVVQPADAITLKPLFDQDPALADMGGAQYLARLAEAAVTIINAPFYAETIRDLYLRRELIAIGEDVVADSYRVNLDDPAAAQIERAEERLLLLSAKDSQRNAVSLGDAARLSIQMTETAYQGGGMVGVGSGIDALDKIISGFVPGDFDIIGGRPGQGKSSLLSTIVKAAVIDAYPPQPVHIFSGEMTAAQLAARLMAACSGIGAGRQRRGDLQSADWGDLIAAQQRLETLPCIIDDGPLVLSRIRQQIRLIKRRQKTALVMIDHLQLMHFSAGDGSGENRNAEVGRISNALKQIAKDEELPIVGLSQLSRRVEERDDKRPMMSDLRNAGEIEQDADIVMLLYRAETYLEKAEPRQGDKETEENYQNRRTRWANALDDARGVAEIIVGKNRHDRPRTAKVRFNAELALFHDPHQE